MSWASRRQFIILFILGAVAVSFFVIISITVFYKSPSCSDGIQNQNEDGVDCGGVCSYLCTENVRPPTVLFTKVIPNIGGRTDVISLVENINANSAAKDVPYKITLYGSGKVFVQEVTGTVDIPPASIVPVFVSGISSGNQKSVQAFLTIDPLSPKWFTKKASQIKPIVSNTAIGGTEEAPRIDAVITNSSLDTLSDMPVVVLVRDDSGEVIAASSTIVPLIRAQGQATATFTWNRAFIRPPAKVEVLPVLLLQDSQAVAP